MENASRNKRALMALAGFLIVILAVVVFVRMRSGSAHPISGLVKAAPVPVHHADTVKPNHTHIYSLDFTSDQVPGTLTGQWMCQGKSANIKGANDDTLIAFRLKGPDNAVMQQQPDHPLGGNFSVRVTRAGTYAFEFDNSGLIRSSARQISMNGSYQAD